MFKLWFGFTPIIDDALLKLLEKKLNDKVIGITGGIGSGKSTFSNEVLKGD